MLILNDDNMIGCEEIGASLLALDSVDPTLISIEWIRNHYRWIVWKLASMELRLPSIFAHQVLTPINVLEQLKYRYDVEIDRSRSSALKRIIEQVPYLYFLSCSFSSFYFIPPILLMNCRMTLQPKL